LLKYTQEIDRVQTNRKNNPVQLEETKPDNAELALLCNNGQALSPQASGQSSHVLVRASSCKAAESPATMAAAVAETPGAEAPAGPFLVQPSVVRTSEQAQPSNPARTFGTIPDAMII
jgi:hypothetical protein